MVTRVELCSDIIGGCVAHALSTEYEEVMGLLLGHYYTGESGEIVRITRLMALTRKDKKRDRVEVGFENLAIASTVAEELSKVDNTKTNVVGWYHSHPHITVFPSHVDCRTQGLYQSLDSRFVGLIISAFNRGKLETCAFQSVNTNAGSAQPAEWLRSEVPLVIVASSSKTNPTTATTATTAVVTNTSMEHLINLNYVLLNEERCSFEASLHQIQDSNANDDNNTNNNSYGTNKNSLTASDIMLLASAYQVNLSKMMETQLLPLQSAAQSRYANRLKEKERLLQRINTLKAKQSSSSQGRIEDKWTVNERIHKKFDEGLAAYRIAAPQWDQSMEAIRLAAAGIHIASGKVLTADGTEGIDNAVLLGKAKKISDKLRFPCLAMIAAHHGSSLSLLTSSAASSSSYWTISFDKDSIFRLVSIAAISSDSHKADAHLRLVVSELCPPSLSPILVAIEVSLDERPSVVHLLQSCLAGALRLDLLCT